MIKYNKQLSDRVYLISLEPKNRTDAIFDVTDGKHIYIKFNEIFGENHPFSVLHFNKSTGEILIAYKVFGKFTKKLSNLSDATSLKLSGAFGNFLSNINPNADNVFIAGGIGVTPFVDYLSKNPDNSHLIYFNHSVETSILVNELSDILENKLSNIYSNVNNQTILTRDQHPVALIEAISHQNIDIKSANFYISAQSSQVKSFVTKLKSVGVSANQIEYETFDF